MTDRRKQILVGEVVSDKMDKTIVVRVVRRVKHHIGKFLTRSTKIHVHDEENTYKIGDRVTIQECRPISKNKSWTVVPSSERKGDQS